MLDASALLAFLRHEAGWDVVQTALENPSWMNVVNLSEVLTKLAEAGANPRLALADLERDGVVGSQDALVRVVPLEIEEVIEVASLRSATKAYGLSLGDRACLATARRLDLEALTADRRWADIPGLPVTVRTI